VLSGRHVNCCIVGDMRSLSISMSHRVNLLRLLSQGALALLIGCSSQSLPEAGKDAGGTPGVGGNTGSAQDAQDARDARDARDAGDAVDTGSGSTDALIVGGCRLGEPLLSTPCFTCAPLPADGHNVGCGGPLPTLWGWDGSGIADGVVYPLDCTVYLPVENPYYPGGPQSCGCWAINDSQSPQWTCGI
jgi:hypothetical protein